MTKNHGPQLDFIPNPIKFTARCYRYQSWTTFNSIMKFPTAFLALFRQAMLIVIASFIPTFVSANDWLRDYVHRPAAEVAATDSLLDYVTPTRNTINLNGIWDIRRKHDPVWSSVFVPGAYEFEGEIEFRRKFEVDSSIVGKTLKLIALGINNRCSVFINGSFVASHSGGHTSFVMDIPREKILPDAPNEILIAVQSMLQPRSSLPLRHRPHFPFNYGGIFRDIFLLATPTLNIEDVHISQTFSSDYTSSRITLDARIQYRGSDFLAEPLEWRVEILDSSNAVISRSQQIGLIFESGFANASVSLDISNPKLWSPENPRLHQMRSYLTKQGLVVDEVVMTVGFSEFRVAGKTLSLNGQPLTIKGFDWFESYGHFGPLASLSEIRRDVQQIKATGANTVRVIGVPPHPLFLKVCDEFGLLVFQELPLTMVPDGFFANQDFLNFALTYLDEMINRDARHVSMAAWGLGADLLTDRAATAAALNYLSSEIRNRSALPTYMSFRFLKKIESLPSVDFLILDAYNHDEESSIQMLNMVGGGKNNIPKVVSLGFPLLISHTAGIRSWASFDDTTPVTPGGVPPLIEAQQRQAERLQSVIARIDSTGRASGVLIHSFADWRETRPNLLFARRPFPDWHASGVVSSERENRVAYGTVRSFFLKQPPRPLTSKPVETQNPIIYPVAGLGVILLFLFNLNRDNRFRGNLRRVFLYPHGFHMELRERRKVPFSHTVLVGFTVCMLLSIIVSGIAFRFRLDLLLNSMLDLFIAPMEMKLIVSRLIWTPIFFIPAFCLFLFGLYTLVALFLKLLAFVFSENLPLSQFYALVIWDTANFVWLLPIVPIYYRIISQTNWAGYAILFVSLFAFWMLVRMFRSVRVLYNLSLFNALFMAFILGILILGGCWWYIDDRYATFDYLPSYLRAF